MEVSFYSRNMPPYWIGGAERRILELSQFLKNEGVKVNIISCGNKNHELKFDGLKIRFLPIKIGYVPWKKALFTWPPYLNKLKRIIKKDAADVIHSRGVQPFSLATIYLSKKMKKKCVISLHDSFKDNIKRKISFFGENLLYGVIELLTGNPSHFNFFYKALRSVDKVVGISRDAIKTVEPYIDKKKIEKICFGVNLKDFRPKDFERENFILFVGRLVERKGLHVLLNSMLIVRKQFPDIKLYVIGIGKQDYYKKIIKELGLKKSVKMLDPIFEKRKLAEMYNKAKLVVVPSLRDEALGSINIEAMSCGTPVVSTMVGGIPEVVIHGKTGLLVEPNNVKQLANSIIKLLGDGSLREKMGEEGIKWVNKEFNMRKNNKKMLRLYEKLTG